MGSTRKLLQDIAANQDFERLSAFREAKAWKKLTDEDRELLAHLFIASGDRDFESEKPEDALRAYDAASKISLNFKELPIRGRVYWRWALCWRMLGQASGEVSDYSMAMKKLRLAKSAGVDQAEFWIDYGHIVREFSELLQRAEMLHEAWELLVKATKMKSDLRDAWVGLALMSQNLYHHMRERIYFTEANRAFRMAATLAPLESELWLKWGQLSLEYGKWHHDIDVLQGAIERFEKVNEAEVDPWALWSGLAEAQILVGAELERLDLMQQGMEKCRRCLELTPNHAKVIHIEALGMIQIADYFCDEGHFQRAADRIKHELTSRPEDPQLWAHFAEANHALAELRRDRHMMVRAIHCYTQVLEHGGTPSPQFFNDWGMALMRLGEMTREAKFVEQAVEKFEQAVAYSQVRGREGHVTDRDTLNPEWLYHYGCALDCLGEFTHDSKCYEKAIQVLSQVIILDANFSHARYNLALAFYHLADLVQDLECFHKSLELFQSVIEQDAEDDSAWTDWGIAYISLAELMRDPVRTDIPLALLEQAEEKLRHAAALGNTGAFYYLACVYSLSGNLDAALHYLDRASLTDNLPPLEDVVTDEWLADLQQTTKFREWLSQLGTQRRDTLP